MTRPGGWPLPFAMATALAVLPLFLMLNPAPVLAQAPDAGTSAFLEGAALVRDGEEEQAVPLLQKATQENPQADAAWYYLGVALFKLERYAEAIPALEKAAELAQFRPGTRFYLGRIYESQGDYERALEAYTEELRIRRGANPDEVLVALGRTQLAAGRYRDALASFKRALDEDPNYVEAYYYRGLTLDTTRRPEEAVAQYKEAKRVLEERDRLKARLQRLSVEERRETEATEQVYAQKFARAEEFVVDLRLRPALNKALGEAYLHADDPGRARMQYRESMKTAEGGQKADPEAHVLLGQAYMDEGYDTLIRQNYVKGAALMLDEGVKEFREALKYDPNNADAYVGIGRTYDLQATNYGTDSVRNITSHTYDEAIAQFKQALQLDPDHTEAMKYLAATYNHQGEYQLARQQLEAGIALAPRDAGMYAHLAVALVGLEQYKEAVTQAETSLAMDPDNYEATNALGVAHYYLGDLSQAIPNFERAIRIDQRNHQAYTNLGNAYFQAQSWHRAIQYYDRALELIPESRIAGTLYQRAYLHYLRGRAYLNSNMFQSAIRAFNEALTLDGSYFDCTLALAEAHMAADEYRAAKDALRDALSKSPGTEEDARVHFLLGQVYEAARQPHDAMVEYGLALRDDPANAEAQRALMRLQGSVTSASAPAR